MTPFSRKSLESTLDAISSRYVNRAGQEICLDLTETLDKYLSHFGTHFFDKVGVFAIGGYGRRELSRYSDLDLLILYENYSPEQIQEWLTSFLHPLWDARLEVKYSAHTFREMETKIQQDTDFATALLDYRPLQSNPYIIEKFSGWMENRFHQGDPELLSAKLSENTRRRQKYGETYKLIEPDIKESAGGLRDLHTIQWIAITKGWRKPGVTKENISGTLDLLEWMLNQRFITVREYASLKDAFNFLLQIRHGIHITSANRKRKTNLLDINIRNKLAKTFGYKIHNKVDVQAFMQAYYRAARAVDYAHQSFLNEHLYSDTDTRDQQPIPEFPGLFRTNGSIDVNTSMDLPRDVIFLMQIFRYARTNDLHLRQNVREKIEDAVHSMSEDEFRSKKVGMMLKRIFQEPDAGDVLRMLLHSEILSKIIPEIAQIRRLHIPSRYHFYTVDEHSFRAIDNLQERTLNQDGDDSYHLSKTYHQLTDTYPLYLALLLHDIGKATESEDHEEHGSALVGTILKRLNLAQYVETVAFLIRNHLLMEEIAFRRDTNRPEVIERFASSVETVENLRMLYLLTFADISAVKPNLWTDWKATLLYELFWKTIRYLEGKPIIPREEAVAALHEDEDLHKFYVRHLTQMEERYQSQFSEPEIYQHVQAIRQIAKDKNADAVEISPVEVIVDSSDVLVKVTVITEDRPRLLSLICGAMTSLGYSIIDAAIFTREDDLVIDQFRVVPVIEEQNSSETLQVSLKPLLKDLFNEKKAIAQLVSRAEQQWRWKQQALPEVTPKVERYVEDKTTVLEVTGQDRAGLLYHLTRRIADHGFVIESARIHTENQSITDSFYIIPSRQNGDDEKSVPPPEEQLQTLAKELLEFLG